MQKVFGRMGLLLGLSGLLSCVATESNFTTKLDAYAKTVAASASPGTFTFLKSKQTMTTPLVSYVVTFSTADSSFYSNPKAAIDRAAYVDNTGRRMIWEAKFCTKQLKEVMRKDKINIVSGELVSQEGQTQFTATCVQN